MKFSKVCGIRLIYDPETIRQLGYKGGAGGFFKLKGEIFPKRTIIIDDWTAKQKKTIQDFLIYHEAGHIKHHDSLKMLLRYKNQGEALKARLNMDPAILEMEKAADTYAANIIGNKAAINAMKRLKRSLSLRARFGTPGKEIKLRIKNLK